MTRPLTQAQKDALADAETLRLVAAEEWDIWSGAQGNPFVLHKANAKRARGRGSLAYEIRKGRYYAAARIAADCAHEAFRAVPGLRGDQ